MKRLQLLLVNLAGRLLRTLGFRPIVTWLPDRIGHLVGEVDTFIKERAVDGDLRRPLFVFSDKRLANPAVLDMWKRVVTVIVWPRLYEFIRANKNRLSAWEVHYLDSHQYGRLCSAYQGPPPLCLNERDHAKGRALLRELGIGPECWHVCFHNRESGYLPELAYHAYRDAPASAMNEAMRWVVAQGGVAVRMGDPTMTPLPPMEGVVDYAHSEYRTPFLDVYLSATCRFMLGCSSGLFCLAAIFGRPVACANMTPMSSIPFYPGNRFIPMLVRETATGRFLTFDEVLGGPAGAFWRKEAFDELGLETVANDADDLLGLTREMLRSTENGGFPEPDRRQRAFRKLLRPEHTGHATRAVLGAAFAEKHQNLFQGS